MPGDFSIRRRDDPRVSGRMKYPLVRCRAAVLNDGMFRILLSAVVLATAATATPKPPNVLFIAVDDLNDWVGCLGGHPQAKTPNIDRLAADGVLFRNAYTAAASCNPSRSAIFSGRAPWRSGLYGNLDKLRDVMPDEVLMPRHFSNHGYWSAGSGKLLHYVIDPPSWDDYHPAKEKDDPFPPTFYPPQRPVSLPRGGPWQYVETDWAALDVDDETYGGDWLVSKWIGEQLGKEHDQPFFLGCGIYRPHEPWFVPKAYFEPFPLEDVQLPPGYRPDDLDDVPPLARRIARNRYFPHILWNGQWRNGVQGYLASIHFSDAMVGRVLDALEKGPNAGNTIVVLWSDHGWHLGEKEHWQKFTSWRACARVPLIVRVPKGVPGLPEGTTAGSVCDRPVSLLDLFGTLTELCGIEAKPGIESGSIVPLLRDPRAAWDRPAITQLDRPQNYAVSTQRWRYLHYADGGEELYDIQEDPYEWHNRAGDSACAAELARLRALAPKDMKPVRDPELASFEPDELASLQPLGTAKAPASAPPGRKVTVLFQNKRQFGIRLIPIDQTGARGKPVPMKGATRRLMDTVAGQVWLVLDDEGKPLGYHPTGPRPTTIVID
jgi:arylsulfatase A-like enzyme